jgi:hypothetical protein
VPAPGRALQPEGSAMKLAQGMLIKTNYNTGPYRIKKIKRDCTCAHFLAEINMNNPPPLPPHLHLTVTNPDGSGEFYLNYYDEETLIGYGPGSYDGTKDQIIVLTPDMPLKPLQMDLF